MAKGFRQLIAEAVETINEWTAPQALEHYQRGEVTFFDLRDEPEVRRDGKIPGAIPASRGMLEFYADPASPYHKPEFESAKTIVLYCASGGRSALGAQRLKEMGRTNVVHVAGGLKAWKEAQGPVELVNP